MLKSRFFLSAVCLVFLSLLLTGNALALGRRAPVSVDTNLTASPQWLVPQSAVEATDIKIVWQYNIPINKNESLDRLYVFDNRLLAITSRNFMTCLNKNDGNVLFSTSIAPAGLPITGLKYYDGELLTVVGDRIVVTNIDTGVERSSMRLMNGAACPVVRNDKFFYIAGNDKRLLALRADNKVKAFEAAAENASKITSVLAEKEFVIFATAAGNVIYIAPDKPAKEWEFIAPDAVIGEIIRDVNSLYFACRDTGVYRLELSTGELLWKHQIQAIPQAGPRLGKKTIYQCLPEIGLEAIDKEAAKHLWQVPDGIGLLAEMEDKAFVVTKTGLITAMDNVKAKKLYSIDIGRPVKFATNLADSMIYIADAKGRVACLKPIR